MDPSHAAGGKLRLMCSYGGQIAPRPNGKSLCYAGGETRIVAFDRRSLSVSVLTAHLSRILLPGRSFRIKYQLPDHDLDSLISITTDEDLINMIYEYDRLALSPTPSRLRFFLFPVSKPTPNSGDYDAKSEAWFFDSLRSARIDAGEKRSSDTNSGVEGNGDSEGKCGGSESIVLETNSSYGSTGSATSVSNLPAAKGGGGEEAGLAHVQDSLGSDASSIKSPTLVYLDSLDRPDSKLSSKLTEPEPNLSPSPDLPKPTQPVYGHTHNHLQQAPPFQPYLQPLPHYINATGSHYAPQYYPGPVPVPVPVPVPGSYATAYALNRPYPVYLMPVGPAGPQLQTSPAMVMNPKTVHDGFRLVQPQRVVSGAETSLPAQTQTVAGSSDVEGVKYGEYDDPLHAQIYKTQPSGPAGSGPFQPVTSPGQDLIGLS